MSKQQKKEQKDQKPLEQKSIRTQVIQRTNVKTTEK
jgi:hypothetical protein